MDLQGSGKVKFLEQCRYLTYVSNAVSGLLVFNLGFRPDCNPVIWVPVRDTI
jgi:hypothetical protein